MPHDRETSIEEFRDAVNMPLKELADWLQTSESKDAGQQSGGGESTGHESGRMIVDILDKKKTDYTDDDIDQMRRVTGYIHRHLAQRPNGDVADTRWRHSFDELRPRPAQEGLTPEHHVQNTDQQDWTTSTISSITQIGSTSGKMAVNRNAARITRMRSAMTTAPQPIQLWPADAPELIGTAPEDIPLLTPYLPGSASPTSAIVICPGGGYQRRADHEGEPVARWLNPLGVAAFVVDYRVAPHRHPAPLLDAQRAIRTVRANAETWNVDPQRVGVLGFSAGGHLAATAATQWDHGDPDHADPVARQGCRPDLVILCYPVISFLHASHVGSMTNLLGDSPTLG